MTVWAALVCLGGACPLLAASGKTGASHEGPVDYIGTFVIVEATPAPWLRPGSPSTSPYEASLLGKTITLGRKGIDAPLALACKRRRYEAREVGAGHLFQGGLTDPTAQAPALGFHQARIPTLITGCLNGLEFHFLDERSAMFALDNVIFTILRPLPYRKDDE